VTNQLSTGLQGLPAEPALQDSTLDLISARLMASLVKNLALGLPRIHTRAIVLLGLPKLATQA
jgi:hypothetical protein